MNKEKDKKQVQKKRKRTARILCKDRREYWTTQAQFWQWVRDLKVVKLQHNPLTGKFVNQDEETLVVINNAILNIQNPNHLRETVLSRKLMKPRRA